MNPALLNHYFSSRKNDFSKMMSQHAALPSVIFTNKPLNLEISMWLLFTITFVCVCHFCKSYTLQIGKSFLLQVTLLLIGIYLFCVVFSIVSLFLSQILCVMRLCFFVNRPRSKTFIVFILFITSYECVPR